MCCLVYALVSSLHPAGHVVSDRLPARKLPADAAFIHCSNPTFAMLAYMYSYVVPETLSFQTPEYGLVLLKESL